MLDDYMVRIENKEYLYQFSSVGYQFPNTLDRDYDGNWLLIKSEVIAYQSSFVIVDPALLTYELIEISEWFQCLSVDKIPKYSDLSFIEPNLEFTLFEKNELKTRFGIRLRLEMKPTFAPKDKDFMMIFEKTSGELTKISEDFRKEYELFPERR